MCGLPANVLELPGAGKSLQEHSSIVHRCVLLSLREAFPQYYVRCYSLQEDHDNAHGRGKEVEERRKARNGGVEPYLSCLWQELQE